MTAAAVAGSTGATEEVRTRTVVAVAVLWRGRLGIFRRSASVDHDQGLWHCVTGYLEAGTTPPQQAFAELYEETGLAVAELDSFREGEVLELSDADGRLWTIHTFQAVTTRRRLILNEEHDAYKWVEPRAVARFGNRVSWLDDVILAAGVVGEAFTAQRRRRT
jgi:8-oxo-dGTP pyrophosphatase MutT (NUDIX family)